MASRQDSTPQRSAVQPPGPSSFTVEVGQSGEPCLQCGRYNAQAAKFCTNCGTPLQHQQLKEQPPSHVHLQVQQRIPSYPPLVRLTPRRRGRSSPLWLVVGIVALVLLSGLRALLLATHKNRPASLSQLTQQSPIPLTLPTPAPTPTPKSVQLAGVALLGGDIGAFIAKYGPPGNTAGYYDSAWKYFVFSKPAVDVVTTEDGRIVVIFVTEPADATWDVTQAGSVCLALAPPDRVSKQSMTLLDPRGKPMALQKVYDSPSLSKRLPASVFTDENAHQVAPGTFSLVLTYEGGDTSKVLQCALWVGLQPRS